MCFKCTRDAAFSLTDRRPVRNVYDTYTQRDRAAAEGTTMKSSSVVVVVAAQLESRPAFARLLVLQFVPHVAVRFVVWPYVLCALIEFITCLCECCHMPHSSEQGRWANHFKTLATKVTTLFVY